MGFFSKIFSKIFPSANAAEIVVAPPPAPAAATAPAAPAVPPSIPMGDVAPILDAMPGASALNWRTSIVDLLKLLGLDSSLSARKELAELSTNVMTGDTTVPHVEMEHVLAGFAAELHEVIDSNNPAGFVISAEYEIPLPYMAANQNLSLSVQ